MKGIMFVTVSTLAIVAGMSAQAADLRGSVKDDVGYVEQAPMLNWSGFYIGAHAGYGMAAHDMSLEATETKRENPETYSILGIDGLSSEGGVFGLNTGFDVRRGNLVFGVLGGYSWSNMDTSISLGDGLASAKGEKDDEWYLGGRVGALLDERNLLYVGAAYVETTYNYSAAIGGQSLGNTDVDYSGVKLIGGFEHAFGGGFFGKLEAQYDIYGKENILTFEGPCETYTLDDEPNELKILAHVSYKFGGIGN